METFQRNLSYLMWLLSRRDYPKCKLVEKLRKRGATSIEIEKLLCHLTEVAGYDEENFKKVRTRQLIKLGYGPQMLKAKLGQHRLKSSKEELSLAYEELGSSPSEEIQKLILKYHKRYSLKSKEPRVINQKITQALMRKGYSYDIISAELKKSSSC